MLFLIWTLTRRESEGTSDFDLPFDSHKGERVADPLLLKRQDDINLPYGPV
jgi:hypothetical protein